MVITFENYSEVKNKWSKVTKALEIRDLIPRTLITQHIRLLEIIDQIRITLITKHIHLLEKRKMIKNILIHFLLFFLFFESPTPLHNSILYFKLVLMTLHLSLSYILDMTHVRLSIRLCATYEKYGCTHVFELFFLP